MRFYDSFNLRTLCVAFILFTTPFFPSLSQAMPCQSCHQELSSPQICSQCRAAAYCNASCQKADWKNHKQECTKLKPSRELRGQVSIRPSLREGAGMGLFAEQEMPKGSFVVGYTGQIVPTSFEFLFTQNAAHAYAQSIVDSRYFVLGNAHPSLPHLAGQLANDPYVSSEHVTLLHQVPCANITPEYLEQIKAFSRNYLNLWVSDQMIFRGLKAGPSLVNLDIETMSDASYYPRMIAKRAILKDEELYYDYGIGYWLRIAVSICNKKGTPQAGTAIERAFSEVIEEDLPKAPPFYLAIQSQTPSYITQEEFQAEYENLQDNPAVQLIRLFGSASLNLIHLSENPAIHAAFEYEPLEKLIAEYATRPNSEFFDGYRHAISHPKSLELLHQFIEELKTRGLHSTPILEDPHTKRTYSWDELLQIVKE